MTLAVSACLLGHKVRFDRGHKHDHFITDELGKFAELLPFCPEDLAFGSPRPSLRMVRGESGVFIQSNRDESNLTNSLDQACEDELKRISSSKLSGIILKSKSPSCGLASAKVYLENGHAEGKDNGRFAAQCLAKFPLIPIEEEGRLQDPWLRENFIMQLFAYDDFQKFKASSPSIHDLIAFHQAYKFMLQAKHELNYRALGNIVASYNKQNLETVLEEYELLFKQSIACKSSIGKTRNVLEHMAGFVKHDISEVEKRTLHEQINEYANKIIPLITPLSTLAMFARHYKADYILGQKFLDPYPKELALRSDIRSGK